MAIQPDTMLATAIEEIRTLRGEEVIIKPKRLAKFGRYASLGTNTETVQEHGGNETFLTDNLIDTVVSSDAGDTQEVLIEGHTIDGSGNLVFVNPPQTVTLNGTTNVTLPTPLARATRIRNLGATDFAGTVKVVDASAPSVIYVQATGVQANGRIFNRSQKAATSISSEDYWLITKVYGAVLKKNTANVDFSLQSRESGGVFEEIYAFDGSSGASDQPHMMDPPLIIPPNSDVRLVAVASAAGVEVIGRIAGYLLNVRT